MSVKEHSRCPSCDALTNPSWIQCAVCRHPLTPGPKTSADWLTHWQELAQLTYGITVEDPRFEPVMRRLSICDEAFRLDSWTAFSEAAEEIDRPSCLAS